MAMERQTESIGRAFASAIQEHWGLFLAEGIILVILGLAAIAVPLIATLAFTIIIGWIFLVAGVVGLITTFWARGAPGFWWSLISAIIAIAGADCVLHYRRHRLDHVCHRASQSGDGSVALDAGERHHRFDPRRHHL